MYPHALNPWPIGRIPRLKPFWIQAFNSAPSAHLHPSWTQSGQHVPGLKLLLKHESNEGHVTLLQSKAGCCCPWRNCRVIREWERESAFSAGLRCFFDGNLRLSHRPGLAMVSISKGTFVSFVSLYRGRVKRDLRRSVCRTRRTDGRLKACYFLYKVTLI